MSYLHQHKHNSQTKHIQYSNVLVNNNIDTINNSTSINVDITNVRANHTNIGTDKEHNNH